MKYHRNGIGVVPKVKEFRIGVAVVRVNRNKRCFEQREHRLHVFDAIVHVLSDFVVLYGTFGNECCRNTVRSGVGLGPCEFAVTLFLSQRP